MCPTQRFVVSSRPKVTMPTESKNRKRHRVPEIPGVSRFPQQGVFAPLQGAAADEPDGLTAGAGRE